jgi:hypothetical protein
MPAFVQAIIIEELFDHSQGILLLLFLEKQNIVEQFFLVQKL